MTLTEIKCPPACLICGGEYIGGAAMPGQDMPEGCRVFYHCGASMSVVDLGHGAYQILFKSCCAKEESKVKP